MFPWHKHALDMNRFTAKLDHGLSDKEDLIKSLFTLSAIFQTISNTRGFCTRRGWSGVSGDHWQTARGAGSQTSDPLDKLCCCVRN